MIDYRYLENEKKVIASENDEKILEMNVSFGEDVAYVDNIRLVSTKREELNKSASFVSSYFNFLNEVTARVKDELAASRIRVNSVLLGNFFEVKELDELAKKFDSQSQTQPVISSKR